ncbi:MAG: hypothetical protein ABIN01_19985 [Ferruginibacter sp.]
MESNSTVKSDEINVLSIISLASLFSITDTDFSEWSFYDDSIYESTFNHGFEMDGATGKVRG